MGKNMMVPSAGLGSVVNGIGVGACGGEDLVRKVGGVTVDWTTVTAVSGSDVTLTDGTVIKIGQKYLRYGQVLQVITASGKYGPYAPLASDGREVAPARSVTVIVEYTVLESDEMSDHPSVILGGTVFKERLLATTGTASLAAGPTFANLEAAMPELKYAQ